MEKLLLQDAGIVQFCKQLGMPNTLITNEILSLYLPSCFVEVFTYGEIQTHHAPPDDRLRTEWFGKLHFGEGRFARELAAFRDGKRRITGADVNSILGTYAAVFAESMTGGQGPFPPFDRTIVPSPVRIQGSTIFFGGNYDQGEYSERLQRPIRNILALEPGIRAIQIIDQQMQFCATNPAALYTYMTISADSFMQRLLYHYFTISCKQLSGDDSLAQALEKQGTYISFQGDIATVTQQIIDGNRQTKQPIEAVDLVIYASYLPPRITSAIAQKALKNVYQMLRPGGALLLGFPLTDSAQGNIQGYELQKTAVEAGFVMDKARIHLGTSNMENPRLPLFGFFPK